MTCVIVTFELKTEFDIKNSRQSKPLQIDLKLSID